MIVKRWTCCLVLMLLMLMPCRGAWAYHEDVHFNLTYVLCRLAELPANDALWIAAADQSMDENDCTTAFAGDGYTGAAYTKAFVNWRYNGLMWHDFCDDGCKPDTKNAAFPGSTISFAAPGDGGTKAREFIRNRYNLLWKRVETTPIGSNDNNRIMADIALGQFLHYEQDFYSHRQFAYIAETEETPAKQQVELDDNAYLPYGTKWGHSKDGDGTTADQVKLRPYLAKKMIADCYIKIRQFASRRSISSPNETEQTLASLIDAIASAYGASTIEKGQLTYNFPSQESVNSRLTSCLTTSSSSSWRQTGTLPFYTADTFALPYDHNNIAALEPYVKKFRLASDSLSTPQAR